VSALRVVIVVSSIITALLWYRCGRKNERYVFTRWAVIVMVLHRVLFYAVRFLCDIESTDLNVWSSAIILQFIFTMAIWGWVATDDV